MQCLRCGRANPVGARFCQECGERLPASCEGCGAALPAEARFCVGCGRPVARSEAPGGTLPAPAVGPVTPAAGPRAPETYTPRHLADRILASRSAVEGERKPVTVLFCDLVGSTPLAQSLGAEGMHGLLSRFFETALGEVHRYEGTINQFLGDGFMALFGAPIAHEDHARRAVLAALGIRHALEARPPEPTPGEPVPVRVRMGLHTGQVVVGAIGDNLRMDYTAVGDTTHLAARLQQHAEPGTICISEATARLVQGYVELEPLGAVLLKGLGEPVAVSRVAGPGTRRSRLEGSGARALSPFVGRDRELRALRDLVERVEAGQGQAVGIVGEPGVGKSRLLLELRETLTRRGLTCLEGRCLSFGAATPYLPVLDLVRAGCGVRDVDPPETTATKVTGVLGEAGLDVTVAGPCVLHLLGLKVGTGTLATLGPEAIKVRTFDTLRQLQVQQSRRRPLAITVEDLHWIDRTSEEYLAFLVDALADARILLVATYRPGYRPSWLERSYATQLALGRLTADDSLSVVRAVLRDAGADDPRVRLVLARAEGNPFFLEELARAVGEVSAAGIEEAVPETVQGVLAARIDRLSEPAKRVLQAASVLGRECPRRLLEAVWEGEELDSSLRELTRQEFLREVVGADETTFAFKHALTQDVARSTLLAPRRRELHRRAADALLALQPDRRDLAPILAHHFFEAGAWAEAAEHAGRAAAAASAAYANREALERYDQALQAAERGQLDPARRLPLHEARAAVQAVRGAFEPARTDLETALGMATELRDAVARARVLGALAQLWGGHRDYARATALAAEAVGVAEASGDRRALAQALWRAGIMRVNLAELGDSRRSLESALALFEELGDEAGAARVLDVLAMVRSIAGDIPGAIAAGEEAVRRLGALGDRQSEASTLAVLSFALGHGGERAAAAACSRRSLALGEAIGARSHEAYIHAATGWLLESYGDYVTALREGRRGLEMAREIGHLEWTVLGLSATGRVLRELGDVEEARRLHEEELATSRALGATIWIADALGELGQDLVAAGDLPGGEARLREAVTTAGEALEFAVRALIALAEVTLRRGRPAEALAAAESFTARLGAFRVHAADARRIAGEALAALGRAAEAEAALQAAKAEATRLGATPPRWRACLALARLHARAGRAAQASAEQAEARELLDAVLAALPSEDLRRSFASTELVRRAQGPPG